MLTFYGFKGSRSLRIAWLLEELNILCKLELFIKPDVAKGIFPKTIKDFSSSGEVPTLKLVDGTVRGGSGFIVAYLLDKNAKGTDLEARNETEQIDTSCSLHTADNIMTDASMLMVQNTAANMPLYGISFLLRKLFGYIDSLYAAPKLHGYLARLSNQIKETGFLVRDHLSGADIAYAYTINLVFEYTGIKREDYPVLDKHLTTLHDPLLRQQVRNTSKSLLTCNPWQYHSKGLNSRVL